MQPFFFLRLDRRYEKIEFSAVRYVQSSVNYCKIQLVDKTLLTLVTLDQMKQALPSTYFCRIHRSYIVRIAEITAFDDKTVYLGDLRLPLSETCRKEIENRFRIVRTPNQIKAFKKQLCP